MEVLSLSILRMYRVQSVSISYCSSSSQLIQSQERYQYQVCLMDR